MNIDEIDNDGQMSPSAKEVWIEIVRTNFMRRKLLSPSAKEVWIEMDLLD